MRTDEAGAPGDEPALRALAKIILHPTEHRHRRLSVEHMLRLSRTAFSDARRRFGYKRFRVPRTPVFPVRTPCHYCAPNSTLGSLPAMNELFKKIQDKTALVGVIGQGYVGLPLALVFCEAGFTVTGFDLDPKKVEAISRGESYIKHIGPERVASAVTSGRYQASSDFSRLRACDAIMICVP